MTINHPDYYNQYPIEVIDMLEKIWGKEKTIDFCYMTAFVYRMRMGFKDDINADFAKERAFLDMARKRAEYNK